MQYYRKKKKSRLCFLRAKPINKNVHHHSTVYKKTCLSLQFCNHWQNFEIATGYKTQSNRNKMSVRNVVEQKLLKTFFYLQLL